MFFGVSALSEFHISVGFINQALLSIAFLDKNISFISQIVLSLFS